MNFGKKTLRALLLILGVAGLTGYGTAALGQAQAPPPAPSPRGTPLRPAANAWSPKSIAYIKASNAKKDDQFGFTVALSGDGNTMAVGATAEDSAAKGINGNQADHSAINAGAVYVFVRSGGNWVQQAYIKASNAKASDQFGASLALSGDGNTLAVGATGESSSATGVSGNQADTSMAGAGAVYVFTRSGATWTQQAYVKASNTGEKEDGDQFGYSIAISADGNTLATGAIAEDSAATGINGDQSFQQRGRRIRCRLRLHTQRQHVGATSLCKALEHNRPRRAVRIFRWTKRQRGHDGRRHVRRRQRQGRCLHFHADRRHLVAAEPPHLFERGTRGFAGVLDRHQRRWQHSCRGRLRRR